MATFKHAGWVWSVAFSPDGKTLATGSEDYTAKLWDVASGKERFTLTGHRGWAYKVAFSPDGRQLASAGFDTLVKLWDVATGKEILTIRGHLNNNIMGVAFRPDGRYLASCTVAPWYGDVKLWEGPP